MLIFLYVHYIKNLQSANVKIKQKKKKNPLWRRKKLSLPYLICNSKLIISIKMSWRKCRCKVKYWWLNVIFQSLKPTHQTAEEKRLFSVLPVLTLWVTTLWITREERRDRPLDALDRCMPTSPLKWVNTYDKKTQFPNLVGCPAYRTIHIAFYLCMGVIKRYMFYG